MLEPAAAGAAVVTGAHTHNFHAIVDLMVEAGAIVQLPPVERRRTEEITNVLAKLLANPDERDEIGRRAKQLVTDNQGAAERTIKLIARFFKSSREFQSDPILAQRSHFMKSFVLPPLSILYGAVTRTRLSLVSSRDFSHHQTRSPRDQYRQHHHRWNRERRRWSSGWRGPSRRKVKRSAY